MLKFDVQDFEVLEAIHQQGSFTKAAASLYRTTSAITQSIQKLEDQIGFQIFDRSIYRPKFTQEGQLFLDRGRHILRQMQRLEQDLSFIKMGFETEFAISYDDLISTQGLYSLIKAFQKEIPGVTLRLYREVLNGCWDALLDNRAHLALGASGEPPLGLNCGQKTFGTVEFVFTVAKDHPLASLSDPLSKEDINKYYNIVVSDTSKNLSKRSTHILTDQPKIFVATMEEKINAQVQGLGVGYLPAHKIKHLLKKGKLIPKMLKEESKTKTYLKIIWRTDIESKILSWFLNKLDTLNFKLFL